MRFKLSDCCTAGTLKGNLLSLIPVPSTPCRCSLRTLSPPERRSTVGRFRDDRHNQQTTRAAERQLVAQDSKAALVKDSKPLVVIISGPSGVGKDAVVAALCNTRPRTAFVVTATTRSIRPGEVNGEDYVFVSEQTFEAWIQQGDLVEHARVYGDYKGIPKSHIDLAIKSGKDVILRLDVQGARTMKSMIPDSVCIFMVAESDSELIRRLTARKTEHMADVEERIRTARIENSLIEHFDYVVVNHEGSLHQTVSAVCGIMDAEKLRVARRV